MRIGLILAAAGSLWAQEGVISGPTSGFVFDHSTQSLRPVLGVPGASTIGAPVRPGAGVAAAWVSPGQDLAIARTGEGALQLFRMNGGALAEIGLDGSAGGPQSVVYSPSGKSALLTTAGGVYVLTGLPDKPHVAGKVDVPVYNRRLGTVGTTAQQIVPRVSMAVSDDGAYVLVAANGSVRVVTVSGENRKLADVTDAAVAFAAGSHDGAAADAASGVSMYRNLDGSGAAQVLAAHEDFGSPSGVAFSNDGKRVFVSASAMHGIVAYDAASGARSEIACECSPAGLVRMGDVFRLNDLSGEPLWILDPGRGEAKIVFVPAMSN